MMKNIKLNNDDLLLIIGILENRAYSENKMAEDGFLLTESDLFLIDQIAFLVDELKTQSENK